MGTPWLRMFDQFGQRIDEILYPPEYWKMLKHGYQAGAIWRAFEEQSMLPAYRLGYITAFYDPGLYCPYTVSLSTAVILEKYDNSALKERFLEGAFLASTSSARRSGLAGCNLDDRS